MTTYKIHPIVVGSKVFDKGVMTYQHDHGTEYTIPIYVWYIEGGDKKILVDTGVIGAIRSDAREKAIGGKIYTFDEGLATKGLKPDDIDIVIHTHLHNDHCENDERCTNAVFYVHEKELEAIYNPHALDYRYVADFIEELDEQGRMIKIKGDQEIVPGIKVLHTPAHTRGGLTVLIDTEKGKAAITGFCTILENFNPPKSILGMEMEVIPPGIHLDVYQAYDQVLKVKNMADIILPLHEPRFASIESIPSN